MPSLFATAILQEARKSAIEAGRGTTSCGTAERYMAIGGVEVYQVGRTTFVGFPTPTGFRILESFPGRCSSALIYGLGMAKSYAHMVEPAAAEGGSDA